MISKLPLTSDWIEHIEDRVVQAKELKILGEDYFFSQEKVFIFIPDWLETDMLTSISPKLSLSDIVDNAKPSGWVKRLDMFDDVAKWIVEKEGKSNEKLELICEAGYSKIGDKVLQERPHVIFNNAPFLNSLLDNSEKIAQVLRWGRSWRLLGIIANDFNNEQFDVKYFICDVFDGDSIIILKSA